jgi:hypothetical protein
VRGTLTQAARGEVRGDIERGEGRGGVQCSAVQCSAVQCRAGNSGRRDKMHESEDLCDMVDNIADLTVEHVRRHLSHR